MTCPQCHADNPAGSRFCHKCGAALSPASVTSVPAAGQPAPGAAAHRHFAPTATVMLVGAGVLALLFLLILGAGATFAIRAVSHRTVAQGGGIRPPVPAPQNPAAPQPTGPASGGQPASPQPPVAPTLPPPPPAPGTPAPAPAPGGAPAAPAPVPPAPAGPGPGGAPTPIPVPPPQGGGGTGQTAVPMQRYRAGSGTWGIDYPQGWQVREAPATSAVVFFQDDPDEGTAYSVVPWGALQGDLSAKAVLTQLAATVRQQYPDFSVRVLGTRDVSQAGMSAQMLDGEASWTGRARQPMRGVLSLIVIGSRGSGMTNFILLVGQAPSTVFGGLRPVFTQMTQSLGGP